MSKELKLTPWFPGDVKPVREGVYQRRYGSGDILFCWWNGRLWNCGSYYVEGAIVESCSGGASLTQDIPWRGVEK